MQRLAKVFTFDEDSREGLTYSDAAKVRLSNDDRLNYGLELKKGTAGFPTAANLTVRTAIIRPMKVKRWVGFDEDADKPDGTLIRYRLLLGPLAAVPKWWNGSSWTAAGASDWNTAQELATNLQYLAIPYAELAVLVNLVSTNALVTPHLREIRLLGEFEIEWWDDLIYDGVIRSLTSTLRATTDVQFAVAATTSLLDFLTDYPIENKGYNFTGVRAVYNLTDDPQALSNLAGAYTPGAMKPDGSFEPGSVALLSPIAAGKTVKVVLEHVPEIAVHTSQDYYEPERLPAVIFERISDVPTGDRSTQRDNDLPGILVRNVGTLTAVDVGAPRQLAVRMEYVVLAMLQMDQARITDALNRWAANHRVLRTWGLDEKVRVEQEVSLGTDSKTDLNDVKASNGAILLRGVTFWLRDAKNVPLVSEINLTLTNN